MAVCILTYGTEIWAVTKKKQDAKIEAAEMKISEECSSYTRKDQIRNTGIR
jgi:hypothetical protein